MNPNTGNDGYCPICGEWTDNWASHVSTHDIQVVPQPRNRAERRYLEKMARRA